MRDRSVTHHGFTLIELMIVVCIIGVLASVALPTYQRFIIKSKGAEGLSDLSALYQGAVAYWERPITAQGMSAVSVGHCLVPEPGGMAGEAMPPLPPVPYKRTADFTSQKEFAALGFTKADPGYFVLIWDVALTAPGNGSLQLGVEIADYCVASGEAEGELVYAFMAGSDLDGDGMYGGYNLTVQNNHGELRHQGIGYGMLSWNPALAAFCPMCINDID